MKLPVVLRKNKWYNTLTGKYVSKAYAQRINNYFRKNPSGSLTRATGHGLYQRKKPFFEHGKDMTRKMYGKGFQVYRTRDIRGNVVYFSPVYDKFLEPDQVKYIKKLDYEITKKIRVELYRMSRDKERIYHLITWKPYKEFHSAHMLEIWGGTEGLDTFDRILKEARKIIKKYPIGYRKIPIIYAHVSNFFFSDLDSFASGKSFGFYDADETGLRRIRQDFLETLAWYVNKLEMNTYHNVLIDRFTIYIMDFYKRGSKQESLALLRQGIHRLEY